MLGTVRMISIDAINRLAVNCAVESLKVAERGSWMLCHAFKSPAERNGLHTVATKSDFIVFKDSSVVMLYTDFLSNAPSKSIQESSDHIILYVHAVVNTMR